MTAFMLASLRRALPPLLALLVATPALAASGDAALRAKILAAYAPVTSYRITVLGSVRSSGVYVAPNRYEMTTTIEGKPIKTIFVGNTYWIASDGKWQKSDTPANQLDFDIAGLVRNAKANPASPFERLPDALTNGKRTGTFRYTFKNGSDETCNYDPATYLVVRCKTQDLTILYSGYNDPRNAVGKPA
jgi:hypothetical protein